MPGVRTALRRIVDVGGTASCSEAQQHFADHPTDPDPPSKIGGTLTSVQAVQHCLTLPAWAGCSSETNEPAPAASTTRSWRGCHTDRAGRSE
jgi:hypothetical protein